MKKIHGTLAMLVATILWGFAFSAQSSGMKYVGPMLFVMLRSLVGVAALSLVIIIFDLIAGRKLSFWGEAKTFEERKFMLTGGILCGTAISMASIFQQIGLQSVSAGKSGFLTALYIIIVPLAGMMFKRKTNRIMWLAVLLAMVGTYFLTGGIGNIGKGEIFLFLCSLMFSIHILTIDRFAPRCDCVRLSCLQFMSASVVACVASVCFNEPWIAEKITDSLPFWIYCGIGSSAIAFTLQMMAQKVLHPTMASLLMSLESVFGVIGGWLFLHEILTLREAIGCAIIFSAIILTQVPAKKKVR